MTGGQALAGLLELSGERDQWHKWAWAMWREGYQAGHADGQGDGYREGYELAVREWKITAAGLGHLLGGSRWEELDRLRYPPGGRLSWLRPRLADVYEAWQEHSEREDNQGWRGAA